MKKDKGKSPLKPLFEKQYMVTDQCFWESEKPENYNPLDPKRAPHAITLVDIETGTIALLESGSIIKVIKQKR